MSSKVKFTNNVFHVFDYGHEIMSCEFATKIRRVLSIFVSNRIAK